MSEERNQSDDGRQDGFRANPGYVLGQLAKALTTAEEHADRQTRERARQKVEKWAEVFAGLTSGTLAAGSRTPLTGVPAWATLEVVTGGFATSALLAGGELLPHEQQLLAELSISAGGQERQALNSFFLTETGMSRLRGMLASGRYEIEVPEEGALLVVAWLLDQGHADQARAVLDEIGPFFDKLRFYPIPAEQPRRFGSRVYLQDVATTIASLEKIQPNPRILAQKEAIEVWAPLYDRTVELLLETVKGEPPHFVVQENAASRNVAGGWPCQFYPEGWQARAQGLLDDYARLRRIHCLCKKPDRKKENFAQLRAWLQRCINNPTALSEHDVGRVRELLARFVSRRGSPQSAQCRQLRERQTRQSDGPTYHQVSQVVLSRLRKHPRQFGIEEFAPVVQPVSPQEAERFTIKLALTCQRQFSTRSGGA